MILEWIVENQNKSKLSTFMSSNNVTNDTSNNHVVQRKPHPTLMISEYKVWRIHCDTKSEVLSDNVWAPTHFTYDSSLP
jgi:hypothetical protein